MAVGRFQVMALLQAARAHELGFPLESAKSWGLNRAIFYAAAKRGFKGGGGAHEPPAAKGKGIRPLSGKGREPSWTGFGDDLAPGAEVGGKRLFVIGGEVQTEKDFERQIQSRFGVGYAEAWEEALDYVRHFPRETLESREGFYQDVYRPKRDDFATKWTELSQKKTAAKPK